MKYFKAILFTFLMAGIFFGTIIFVDGVVSARKMAEVITTSLEQDNYHILLRAKYQSQDPIIDKEIATADFKVNIKVYETAAVIEDELKSFLEFVILTTEGEIGLISDMAASLKTNTEEIPIWFLKYFNLEVFSVVVEPSSYRILELDDIFDDHSTILESIILEYTPEGASEKVAFPVEINLQKTDLTFTNKLINYYQTNDSTYPQENTTDIKLYQHVEINTASTVMVTGGITLLLIVLLTYYVYTVRPRKKLGKAQPSINLQKDIDKLHEKTED
ncbi:MAG: hypothetical protein M0P09_03570 [Acholeplasmataceae bacterium]|nr:hypothetical protein [Acholeplasmataceae bacterium]